jgi:hypothetical protein
MNRFLKGLKGHEIIVLQSCAGPVQGQNRVFPVRNYTGKTLFSLTGIGLQCNYKKKNY